MLKLVTSVFVLFHRHFTNTLSHQISKSINQLQQLQSTYKTQCVLCVCTHLEKKSQKVSKQGSCHCNLLLCCFSQQPYIQKCVWVPQKGKETEELTRCFFLKSLSYSILTGEAGENITRTEKREMCCKERKRQSEKQEAAHLFSCGVLTRLCIKN